LLKRPLRARPKIPRPSLKRFSAKIVVVQGSLPKIINPCLLLPGRVVTALKAESGKNGSIPVRASLQGEPFKANVVRYRGAWRLYLNGVVRKATATQPGDRVTVELAFDPKPRTLPVPPAFAKALAADRKAKAAFDALAPSRRKELLRYLGNLKQEASLMRNIERMLRYLTGRKIAASPTGLYRTVKPKRRRKTRRS
jgi:hypothetical protein